MKKEHDRRQEIINRFVDDMIKKKIIEFKQNTSTEDKMNTNDDEMYFKKNTVMEILIENYYEMSHEQIRDEVITIMIGMCASTKNISLYVNIY